MKANPPKLDAKTSVHEFNFNSHAKMFIFYGALFSLWLLLQAAA